MNKVPNKLRDAFSRFDGLVGKADKILIVSHERVDGDGLGSMLGLKHHLDERGKKVLCFAHEFAPGMYDFLPGAEEVTKQRADVENHHADMVIFLDIGDIKRSQIVDHLQDIYGENVSTVNIDHHPISFSDPEHEKLIDLHLVDNSMSATAEIVFHYLDHHNHNVNRNIATCLLTGILTDTGNFSNKATTDSSMSVAGSLLLHGANLGQITDTLIRNQSVNALKLWGRALSRLTYNPKDGITTTAILLKDLKECQVDKDAADGIANFLNNLRDTKAVIVFREESDGVVKASLRTTRDDIDVSKIAKKYGGGGHRKAAGFSAKGTLKYDESGWRVK